MFMDVFFGKAGEEDTVEAGVESAEVGAAHVADTGLGLGWETENIIIPITLSTHRHNTVPAMFARVTQIQFLFA